MTDEGDAGAAHVRDSFVIARHDLMPRTLEDSVNVETMATAYPEIRDTRQRQPGVQDLRTAAFVNAINKVARAYLELGIFP